MKRTQKLHVKITSRFVLLFSAALLAFLLSTLPLIARSLSEELEMASQQKVDILSYQIDNALQEVRTLWFSIVRDSQMQTLVKSVPQSEDPQTAVLDIHNRLNQLISPYAGIRSAVMISDDARVLDPIYGTEPYDQLLLEAGEYEKFMDSQLFGRFSCANTFPYSRSSSPFEDRNTITFMGCFFDTETYANLGTVALNCSRSSLFDGVQPTLLDGFARVFLMDQSGQIVMNFFDQQEQIPQAIQTAQSGDIVRWDGRSQAVFRCTLPDYPSWILIAVLDYETIQQPIVALLVAIFFIALLVVGSVAMTSAHISNQITRPLRAVAGAMQQVQSGRWEKVEKIETRDELADLQDGYNEMVTSLELLTQRLAEEQNQKNKIKIAMLQSRLDMLQSQINPHFIHNTLNTMNYLAQKEQARELSALIVSFNGLLRASMSTTDMFYTLAEEVENIRRFVHIHQVRYDMNLRCIYEVAPEAESALIPKLILQPLVENSLFHGIFPKGGGTITKKPTIPVMLLSSAVAMFNAIVFQGFTLPQCFTAAISGFNLEMVSVEGFDISTVIPDVFKLLERGGMMSMLGTVLIAFCAYGFAGALAVTGSLDIVLDRIMRSVKSTFGLVAATIVSCLTAVFVTSNGQLSILIPGEMFRKTYIKRGLEPRNLSRTLEDAATVTEPITPWTAAGVYMATTLGVATLEYLPWAILNYTGIIFALIWAATGIGIMKIQKGSENYDEYVALNKAEGINVE